MARKALTSRRWRGADLLVQEVQIGRGGAGGKALQVHVDSLPADLREAWYLSHGITLHAQHDAATGATVMVPEQAYQADAKFQRQYQLALWKADVIKPLLGMKDHERGRGIALREIAKEPLRYPDGRVRQVSVPTLYNWLRAFSEEGLNGLMRTTRKDTGCERTSVTRAWDKFFKDYVSASDQAEVSAELVTYIRSMWAAGARGWRVVVERGTTRLIELSTELRIPQFDILPTGGLSDKTGKATQMGVCMLNRRMVENHRDFSLLAVQKRDNARFQDEFMPSIRRDYSELEPREIVVGDVHPIDIMMRRPDGSVVYPKGIAWYDVATNEIHFTIVLLEQGEGVRREHVAMSFQAMVEEWGLPKMLYLDNGGEYSWDAMMRGFTQLSRLTTGAVKAFDLDGDQDVSRRVMEGREAIARSRPYNAKGKPGIEGAFSVLEQVFFSTIEGWTAGDRMKKKTHMKGKDPIAFSGDADAFLGQMQTALEDYHKRPQQGRLSGRSPNEALRGFIEAGWGKTVLSDPNVLALAFSEEVERMPDRGRVQYTPSRGNTVFYYADELLGYDRKITLRVPAFNPEFVFCFDGDELICKAEPERTFGVMDRAGAEEVNRRAKAFRRQIAEKRKHVALLSLVEETERHIGHLPDAPDAPVAAVVNAGILDRMAQMRGDEARRALEEHENKNTKPTPISQWKTGENAVLAGFQFAEEDE